jgi:hypothetical protein
MKKNLTFAVWLLLAWAAIPVSAAQFQFSTLIRLGSAAAGAGNYELQAGSNTADLNPYFADRVSQAFSIQYAKATNTATLTVGSSSVSFNPAGGAATAADAIWTLPASSFTLTALGPFNGSLNGTFGLEGTSISLSGLTLTGVSGALNVLQPLQNTTLAASRNFLDGTVTASQSGDVVFQGDSNGDWRLTGTITLTGLLPISTTSGDDLSFGFAASATDVTATPEPSALSSMLSGSAALMLLWSRRRRKKGSLNLQP